MTEIVLPAGHSEADRDVALRIAAHFELDELIVFPARRATAPGPRPALVRAGAPRPGSLVSEVALGLSYLFSAVRLTARGR